MEPSETPLLVAQNDDVVCIKVSGRANVRTSVPFKSLMQEMRDKQIIHFILELENCLLMDSTFLGVLAYQAFELIEDRDPPGSIQLLNPNDRILDLLDNLGVLDLFTVQQDTHFDQQQFEAISESIESGTKAEMTETSLHAHRALIALNPANRIKFQEVTNFLERDLKSQKESDRSND